jgi:hypothetical protein
MENKIIEEALKLIETQKKLIKKEMEKEFKKNSYMSYKNISKKIETGKVIGIIDGKCGILNIKIEKNITKKVKTIKLEDVIETNIEKDNLPINRDLKKLHDKLSIKFNLGDENRIGLTTAALKYCPINELFPKVRFKILLEDLIDILLHKSGIFYYFIKSKRLDKFIKIIEALLYPEEYFVDKYYLNLGYKKTVINELRAIVYRNIKYNISHLDEYSIDNGTIIYSK